MESPIQVSQSIEPLVEDPIDDPVALQAGQTNVTANPTMTAGRRIAPLRGIYKLEIDAEAFAFLYCYSQCRQR